MNKDKFIECGYILSSAYDEYSDNLRAIQDTYLKKVIALDKKFKAKIFTKDAIAEMRQMVWMQEGKSAARMYEDDRTNIYRDLVEIFIADQEEIHGISLF
jgi:hypothetical protein